MLSLLAEWHLGHVNESCAPWGRDFDTYIGYLGGNEGFYNHGAGGFADWHACGHELSPSKCDGCSTLYEGEYSTSVYTARAQWLIRQWQPPSSPLFLYLAWQAVHEPLEVPDRYLASFGHIADRSRRVYAGMLAALDEGIGNITSTLHTSALANSSVVVLSNDNGGMSGTYGMECCKCGTSCGGLNFPYRGYKDGFYEGGFRGIGLVWAPAILRPPPGSYTQYTPLLWVGDWYATLLSAAGHGAGGTIRSTVPPSVQASLRTGAIDSIDAWGALLATANGKAPVQAPRDEVLLAGIDVDKQGAALRVGRHKLLVGSWGDDRWCDLNVSGFSPAYPAPAAAPGLGGEGGLYCMHLDTEGAASVHHADESRAGAPPPPPWWDRVAGLYDVEADPREQHDLQAAFPELVKQLLHKLLLYNASVAPSIHQPSDPAGKEHANQTGCIGPWRGVREWW